MVLYKVRFTEGKDCVERMWVSLTKKKRAPGKTAYGRLRNEGICDSRHQLNAYVQVNLQTLVGKIITKAKYDAVEETVRMRG